MKKTTSGRLKARFEVVFFITCFTCYYSMKINCKAKNIKTVTKRVIREILVILVSFLTNPIMIPTIETIQISFMDNPIKFTAIVLTHLLYLYTIKIHLII